MCGRGFVSKRELWDESKGGQEDTISSSYFDSFVCFPADRDKEEAIKYFILVKWPKKFFLLAYL
jgi:hypothetical protein